MARTLLRLLTVVLVGLSIVPAVVHADAAQEWIGSISVREGDHGGGGKLTATYTVTMAADGGVTGKGNGDYVNEHGGFLVDVAISGTRRADSMQLVFTIITTRAPGYSQLSVDGTLETTVPVDGAVAQGPFEQPGQADEYPQGWVRLECTSCLTEETWSGGVTYDRGSGTTSGDVRFTVSRDGVVAGKTTGYWTYLGGEEVAELTVTGRKDGDALALSITASSKGDGWTLDVTVPTDEPSVHLEQNQDAAPLAYPRWTLDLACLNRGGS